MILKAQTMSYFAFCSTILLPSDVRAELLFPGYREFDPESRGYVRSIPRAKQSRQAQKQAWHPGDRMPFRDYGERVMTDERTFFPQENNEHILIVSARNVGNEYGHRVRLAGKWAGRQGDHPLPRDWPVLRITPSKLTFPSSREAESLSGDVLTGVPLVIEGKPMTREFLVKACSDVAHSYEVDPRGYLGPSVECWQQLSDAWEESHQQQLGEEEFCARLDQVATLHGATPLRRNLLHGLIGETERGEIFIAAITGSLSGIAFNLATNLRLRSAIVLDNGGSTAWLYRLPGTDWIQTLLSGPNHRPKGTAFLRFRLADYLQAGPHTGLKPA